MWPFTNDLKMKQSEYDLEIAALVPVVMESEFYSELKPHFQLGVEYHRELMRKRVTGLLAYYSSPDLIEIVTHEMSKHAFEVSKDRIVEYVCDNDSDRLGWRLNFSDIGYAPVEEVCKVEALTLALVHDFSLYTPQTKSSSICVPSSQNESKAKVKEFKIKQQADPIHFNLRKNGNFYYLCERFRCLLRFNTKRLGEEVASLVHEEMQKKRDEPLKKSL